MKPENMPLYMYAKHQAELTYSKPSAYRSGYTIKLYKSLGGTFVDDHQLKPLKSWFKEKWKDVGGESYPVYRPTVRINKRTPLTVDEIDPSNLRKQIKLKQKIKTHNLPPFIKNNLF
jgi:hypothetical protein